MKEEVMGEKFVIHVCECQPQEWSVTSNLSLLWLYIICREVISMPFPLLL